MRLSAAIVLNLCRAVVAGARSPLAAEVRALASRYHEDPGRIQGRS